MSSNNYWKKPLSVAELLEEAENLDMDGSQILPEGIYITPPENDGENSDCDSGNEEHTDPNNLSSRQLRAEGELIYNRVDRGILLNIQEEEECDSVEDSNEESENKSNNSQPSNKTLQPLKKRPKPISNLNGKRVI